MRIFIFLSSWFLMIGSPSWANDPFRDFAQNVSRSLLKPFARDLGGLLGSGKSSSGRGLGFSGFDVGFRGTLQLRPDKDNGILRSAGIKSFGFPWVQAEIGLPFRFDGFIRGFSYQGLTISGGGLRYAVMKISDVFYTPQLLLSTVGNAVTHIDFAATHFGASLTLSIKTPYITPYLGGGVDRTRLVVKTALNDSSIEGSSTITTESSFSIGFNARVPQFKFVYLNGAYLYLHGNPGFETGIGVRF